MVFKIQYNNNKINMCYTHNPKVVGSNPAPATKLKGAKQGILDWE